MTMLIPSRTQVIPKHSTDDPFDAILRPPPDESPEDREIRLAREEEAKRVSQAIDDSIKAERQLRKKKRIVRLLLLGQSESGKSTTLRQFQRLYTPTAFREERILWRAVIQLNLVRSVRTILDAISTPVRSSSYPQSIASSTRRTRRHLPFHDASSSRDRQSEYLPNDFDDVNASSSSRPLEDAPPIRTKKNDLNECDECNDCHDYHASSSNYSPPPSDLESLKMRLLPIRHIEALLIAKLVPPNEEEPAHMGKGTKTGSEIGSSWRNQEVFVRPGRSWKRALAKETQANVNTMGVATSGNRTSDEVHDEPQEVLHACRRDIFQLWNDPDVRNILRVKKIRLEEFPGFFLDRLDRLTSLSYMPTDDDVLKARLKTIGVSEYKFEMEAAAGRDSGPEWRIVDVGGSRSQRATWIPFFDSVDAIIFLAPISVFDQVLVEDKSVNRLEDSVILWKAVCSNKLLANVDLVLFLNKCDILDAKLKSGVNIAKYIKSYGDRGNDVDSVSKYLRSKFSAIHRECSPNPRKFYAFCTSVTDTATTAGILASVRDMVVRQNLKQSRML